MDVLNKIKAERNVHLNRVKIDQMSSHYRFWGPLAFDSVFTDERQNWGDL